MRSCVQMAQVFLGSFESPLLAARAHDVAVLLCDGDPATLNFPPEQYREVPFLLQRWPDKRMLRKAVCSATGEHLGQRCAVVPKSSLYLASMILCSAWVCQMSGCAA